MSNRDREVVARIEAAVLVGAWRKTIAMTSTWVFVATVLGMTTAEILCDWLFYHGWWPS